MRFGTMFVETVRIKSSIDRSAFSEEELTKFAERLLKLEGGTIRPPVVRETGMYSREYEVISGHFEYYVAVRAMELDKKVGDMTSVFLISPVDKSPEKDAAVVDMVKFFSERESGEIQPTKEEPEMNNLLRKIDRLESTLNQKITHLETAFSQNAEQQKTEFRQFFEQLQKRTADIETIFNRKFEEQKVAFQQLSDSIDIFGNKESVP
jgi:hypothetical protein